MDYNSNYFIKFGGSAGYEGSYVPIVKKEADKLYLLSQSLGGTNLSKEGYLTDGKYQIQWFVNIVGSQKHIYIEAKGGCSNVNNGLIRTSRIIPVVIDGDTKKALNEYYPTFNPSTPSQVRNWINSQPLAIEIDPSFNIDTSQLLYTPSQHQYLKGSMYSGVMRYVAQKILGMNQALKFNYQFSQTHGIYINQQSILTPTSKYWVIQIDANGIYATQLSVCDPGTTKNTTTTNPFPYIPTLFGFPTGDDFNKGLENGTIRQLAPASTMSLFYNNNNFPFFANCGWSFDYTGHNATNTCWSWPDHYKRGARYQISIISDNTGNPLVANIQQAEIDVLYKRAPPSAFIIPGDGGVMTTFDMTASTSVDYPNTASTPVYSYYNTDNTLQVIRNYLNLSTSSETNSDPNWNVGFNNNYLWPKNSSYLGHHEQYQNSIINYPYWCYTSNELNNTSPLRSNYTKQTCDISTFYVGVIAGQTYGNAQYEWHGTLSLYTYARDGIQSYDNAIMIPLYDRESYVYYSSQVETTTVSNGANYCWGQYQGTSINWSYNESTDTVTLDYTNGIRTESQWNPYYPNYSVVGDGGTVFGSQDVGGSVYTPVSNFKDITPGQAYYTSIVAPYNLASNINNQQYHYNNTSPTPTSKITNSCALVTSNGTVNISSYVTALQNLPTYVPSSGFNYVCEYIPDVFNSGQYYFEFNTVQQININGNYLYGSIPDNILGNFSFVGNP